MRQEQRAPEQGTDWQGHARSLSRQDITKKVAIQRQQQQLAAQQADIRLAAFEEARERHSAEAARRRQAQAARAAQPVVATRAPNHSGTPVGQASKLQVSEMLIVKCECYSGASLQTAGQ